MSQRIRLQDAHKGFTLDQDKICSPEETVSRFRAKLKNIELDILDETVRIDNGRLDIPVYFSRCGKDAHSIIGTRKQMGKGATPAQAEASAVMELAERFSFFSFCRNPQNFVEAKLNDLNGPILPFEMIASSVHDDTAELEISRQVFENLSLQWTPAYNLTRKEEVLIPFSWFFAINEFNGPSAGNCVEEALLQGICEIVERHVSSIISRNRCTVPAISARSARDPMVVDMLAKYAKAGIRLHLSDFTLDMGIPTIGALAYDPQTFPDQSEIVWTAGTTPSPEKALSRALTEVAQLAGDFNSGANYVASGLPKYQRLEDANYIIHTESSVDLDRLPDISNNNIRIEVENCLTALAKRDLEVLVINTTHPQLNIPAFYTIIPGAHFRERSAHTTVGMFAAKLITENDPAPQAIKTLEAIDHRLHNTYYVQFYLGQCHLSLNQPLKALTFFKKALTLEPPPQDAASIYSYMGVCLKELERYEEALDVLRQGEQLDKERTDIYNLKGYCHFKLKNHAKAIDNFRQVLALNPGSAIDYANIASNYRDMGDIPNAIVFYQTALTLDDSLDFARENLEKLLKPA